MREKLFSHVRALQTKTNLEPLVQGVSSIEWLLDYMLLEGKPRSTRGKPEINKIKPK